MIKPLISLAATLALVAPLSAQDAVAPPFPSPNEIVGEAPASDWVAIAPENLLVMTLAPAADNSPREVVLQLIGEPFAQGWVANIRTLARAGWYDGNTINRVQDNYVVQWGDPNYDNPEADGAAKPLPAGLVATDEADYTVPLSIGPSTAHEVFAVSAVQRSQWIRSLAEQGILPDNEQIEKAMARQKGDSYAIETMFIDGWPVGMGVDFEAVPEPISWPLHCYGMVGVGRGMSPDAGSGAELYTVNGHAPRHLDRNIALVGRIVSGMEHLTSLPRGSGALGFYTAEEADLRTPIVSVRLASDMAAGEAPRFEYLSSASKAFARYADARANRRDPFFIVPAGGADICNIPVPVRRVAE